MFLPLPSLLLTSTKNQKALPLLSSPPYASSATLPSSILPATPLPPFILWALSLTAGPDYGCEKWGSHASNPPLQHSYSMTAHFLPTLVLGLSLPPSLCISLSFFSCLYFSLSCCFSVYTLCTKELKFMQATVCVRGFLSCNNGCVKRQQYGGCKKLHAILCLT